MIPCRGGPPRPSGRAKPGWLLAGRAFPSRTWKTLRALLAHSEEAARAYVDFTVQRLSRSRASWAREKFLARERAARYSWAAPCLSPCFSRAVRRTHGAVTAVGSST